MQNGNFTRMQVYGNSGWAGDLATRKCTRGHWTQVNGEISTWHSFIRRCVAASSTEAAIVPLAECLQKTQYLHHILPELEGFYEHTIIFEDNQIGMLQATEHGKRNWLVDACDHI